MEYTLNKSIRCDKCHVAEAKQVFEMKAGPLYFCQHHSNRYEATILEQGGVLIPQLEDGETESLQGKEIPDSDEDSDDNSGDDNEDLVGSTA